MTCYRKGGCGPYEMLPCGECPASKPEYVHKHHKKTRTRADRIRGMSDEELAEFMASQVVTMADSIFGIAERVLMEKRGYKISFTDNFAPDLVEIKREYLEMLRQEVEQ